MTTSYFLHAADLHLGAQLKSLGTRVSAEKAENIRREVRRVFDDLVNVAIERKVDFVVLAGDVYDQAENDPAAQLRVNAGFKRLGDAGIKVFMVHGNHDPMNVAQRANISNLPTNVTVFDHGQPQSYEVTMSNGVVATVAGVSFEKADEKNNLAVRFAGLTGAPLIAVMHANVGGSTDHDPYAPCTPSDLMATHVNYWALGHIHIRSVNGSQNKWWVYPGNLQGRSTKAAECGPKGVMVVPVDQAGSVLTPEFVPCDRARFERVVVDAATFTTVAEILERAVSAVLDRVTANGNMPVLASVEITGATEAHADLAVVDVLGQLIERTEDSMGDGQVIKVVNSTRSRTNIADVRASNTIAAKAVGVLDALAADPLKEVPVVDNAPATAKKYVNKRDDSGAQVHRQSILDDARELLVDVLWGAK